MIPHRIRIIFCKQKMDGVKVEGEERMKRKQRPHPNAYGWKAEKTYFFFLR